MLPYLVSNELKKFGIKRVHFPLIILIGINHIKLLIYFTTYVHKSCLRPVTSPKRIKKRTSGEVKRDESFMVRGWRLFWKSSIDK